MSEESKVIKSQGWSVYADFLRSANRYHNSYKGNGLGFRVVRASPKEEIMKPTLDDIFLRSVKITTEHWDSDEWIQHSGGKFWNSRGGLGATMDKFLSDFPTAEWRIWEEPEVKPQMCPFCGNPPIIDTFMCITYVSCVTADCELDGPVRDTKEDAVLAWNRIRLENS